MTRKEKGARSSTINLICGDCPNNIICFILMLITRANGCSVSIGTTSFADANRSSRKILAICTRKSTRIPWKTERGNTWSRGSQGPVIRVGLPSIEPMPELHIFKNKRPLRFVPTAASTSNSAKRLFGRELLDLMRRNHKGP